MGVSPAIRNNGGGGVTGGGYLRHPLIEHSHTFHCDQALYVPVYDGREMSRVTGRKSVLGTESIGQIWDVDGGSGGRTGGGRGEDEQVTDRDV